MARRAKLQAGTACITAALVALWAWPLVSPASVVAHRRGVLALLALATLAAGLTLYEPGQRQLTLRIDPSSDPLLPDGDPGRTALEQAVRDFGDDEVYVVAVVCDAVFSAPCLRALERAGDRLARLDAVRSVSHLVDATQYAWDAEHEWVDIRPFIDPIPDDPAALDALRARAVVDPVYRRTLLSDDAKTAALNVRFRDMDDAEFIARDLDGQVVRILHEELGATRGFHLAGRPHVKVAVYRGMVSDLLRLVPAVALAMVGVLWVGLGGARGVVLPLGAAATAVLWTHAALVQAGHALDLIGVLLAPMLLAVASVYGVHVMARYDEVRARFATAAEAAEAALREIRLPSSIACVTTMIGFAALFVSDVPAVRRFGAFAALGILAATALALTAIPALLATGAARPVAQRGAWRLDRALGRLAGWVQRNTRGVLVATAIVVVVSALLVPHIVIDTDQLSNFAPAHPVRVDFDEVNTRLAGAVPLYLTIDGTTGSGTRAEPQGVDAAPLRDPRRLEAMASLQAAIDEVEGVRRTISIVDSLRPLQRAFAGGDPAQERIPSTRAGVAELLFMMPREETARLITLDHARANLVVRTGVVGSSALLGLGHRIEAALAAHPLPEGMRAELTGQALILARGADGLARSQPLGVLLAGATIAVLVSLALGSVRLGLVTMVPNGVPLLAYYGLLGTGVATLSLPTSLVGSMALGIAIDDSVHFMVRYGRERRAGGSPAEAALDATRGVGRPIAVTSGMLVLGFAVMAASEFATLREFGALAAWTMASCLAADLVLLPALLVRLRL